MNKIHFEIKPSKTDDKFMVWIFHHMFLTEKLAVQCLEGAV